MRGYPQFSFWISTALVKICTVLNFYDLFFSLSNHSSDSPVLWVRIDPEVTWLRHVTFEQPDYMWQYQLRHERDVIAQSEVLNTREYSDL